MIPILRQILWRLTLAAVFAGWDSAIIGQETNTPSRKDFTAYKAIIEKNIFDPRRSGRSGSGGSRGDGRRPRKVDSFTLVGTLFSEKGGVAFFDGSGSEFKKAVRRDARIAGFKVEKISPNEVTLVSGTNRMDLRVAMTVRREEDGEWQANKVPAVASAAARTDSDSSDSSSDGEVNDVLKRLMQQREQESK
jgi:hypothetical protein